MPKVKINKQLNRPDGGVVASGSLAVCNNPMPLVNTKQVVFLSPIYLTETSYDNGKTNIPAIDQFKTFKLVKQCDDAEWDALNDDAGAGVLMGTFMAECIDAVIGAGFTELVG